MPPRPFSLPAYQIDNAMVNFAPVNEALTGYTRGIETAGRSTAQINAANAMAAGNFDLAASETARSGDTAGALAVRRHPQELRALQDAERDRETRRLAGRLQPIIGMPDGPERAAAWRTLIDSDPRWRQSMTANGMNPDDHMATPLAIHSEAIGPRDPLEQDRLRAQTDAARATALHHNHQAVTPGSSLVDLRTRETVATAAPRPRELSPTDLRGLREDGSTFSTISRLGSTFQSNYSMPSTVVGGDISNWIARNVGGTGPMRDAAQWWQDYQRNSELTERHALFGAALTATEQASWRAATITPNMTEDAIRRNLATRQELLSSGIRRYSRALVSAGYDGAAIAEALGIPPAELGITGQGRRQNGLTPPGPGATGPAPTGQLSAADAQAAVANARQAVARGADRAAVIQRLEAAGIVGHGL